MSVQRVLCIYHSLNSFFLYQIGVKGSYTLAMSKAQFADGTTIPKGSYKILVRALRVTGDLTKDEDYDSWLSPGVGVV